MNDNDNILEYVPIQNCPFEKDDKSHVFLIRQKTGNRLLKKIIAMLGRSQDFHIHLDELGSRAWLEADGRRTILEIATGMKTAPGVAMEQAEQRLAKFFAVLARDGFVRWRDG